MGWQKKIGSGLAEKKLGVAKNVYMQHEMTSHQRDILYSLTVADPGSKIPRRWGCQPSRRCQHTILPNFPKSFIELKEFEPPGGTSVGPPLDPPMLNYRPQHSSGKVMFSQACVKNSVHWKGLSASVHAGMHTPRADSPLVRHPPWSDTPGQTPPWLENTPSRAETPQRSLQRTVCILLECILEFFIRFNCIRLSFY